MTQPANIPANEDDRLSRLRALNVLDTGPEPLFDALTRMAATICGTPISLISLVDEGRQWFKANVGLPGVSETPRDVAFCSHAILDDALFEVPDATKDARFVNNPLVTNQPDIRFYAGAPIVLEGGERVGTLCVIDRIPGKLTQMQSDSLRELAYAASQALAMRQTARAQQTTLELLEASRQELANKEALYRALVEDQSELVSLASPDGRLQYVNSVYAQHFGLSPQEMVSRNLLDFVAPKDRIAVESHLLELCLKPGVSSGENQMRSASGQERWVAWTNRSVGDDQGGVVALHSVGRDISDRKLAEHELAQAQDRIRRLYEATPVMMHSIGPDGGIVSVSDLWLSKMGYAREEVVGVPSSRFLSEESRRRAVDFVLPEFFRTGRCDNVAYEMVKKDGSLMEVLLSATLERDISGAGFRSLAVLEDVTEKNAIGKELLAKDERLQLATEVNSIGIWEYTTANGQLDWSDSMFSIFDLAKEDFGGTLDDWRRSVHPDDLARSETELAGAISGARPFDFDFRAVLPDGGVRHVNSRGMVFCDAQGQATRVLGTNYDISDRKRLELTLANEHELLRVTLQSIGDAVITTDHCGTVNWLNPVAERMTGWLNDDAVGKPLAQVFHVVHEESRQVVESPVERCLAEVETVGLANRTVLVSRNGVEYGIEDSASPIRDSNGTVLGAVLVFHDVSEQRRLSGEMSFRVSHDALTGLTNRSEFEMRLERLLTKSREDHSDNALMFIDLDQFKLVNDACGHAMGDQLLCQVSKLLRNTVRARDTLARLGGDEFGVILEHCSAEQARNVAQQICDKMEEFRFNHDGRRFRIGTSIGLVPVDRRWTSLAAVMQAADTSCYAAKEAGRNRVHIWFDTDQAMRARKGEMQWASRLEQALDEGRFLLYAQKIVPVNAVSSGLHCEVLLRLRDTDGSIVLPGAFLPAAERFHMASRIDRWVVQHVFEWMSTNKDSMGYFESVAVNLSGQSIGDRAFHRFVVDLVKASSVDVRKLCFEITETAAITNLADATVFIDEIRSLGLRMSLDDFGAGASSFGYLKTLPVDYLKIDGQFIRDVLDDELDHAAVCCFRDVAKVVGVKTVAEFVESEEILSELKSIGIDYAQGYLIHRPEPLQDLLASTRVIA
mgnify:CR=1 FL=1